MECVWCVNRLLNVRQPILERLNIEGVWQVFEKIKKKKGKSLS